MPACPPDPEKPPIWQQLAVSCWLSFLFVLVYNGCNYLASTRDDVGTCAFEWELGLFPFIPILIIPYWSIDLFFVLAPFFIRRRYLLGQHLRRVSAGIVVAGVFFLLFPLELAIQRPPVEGWLAPFFSSLENFHNFYNCAPSLHIILRTNLWAIYVTPTRGALRYALSGWFFLIGASTLFCWQHHIMDVFTGQLVGLLCLWAFPSVPFDRVTTRPQSRVNASYRMAGWYGGGCLTLVGLAVVGWPGGMLFLWPAAALFILTLAYLGGGPALLRKQGGRQLPSTRWLLNPYRWLALVTARHFNAGIPPWVELEPGLLLGRRLSSAEASTISATAVLDLSAEYDECEEFLSRTYRNIPVLDLTTPSLEQLQEGVDFLRAHPNCYVHCSLGRGRTCLLAAAYKIASGESVEAALAKVREARPEMRLPLGSTEQLRRYALSVGSTKN